MNKQKVLDINNLVVEFASRQGRATAINNISLHINKGEIFGLVGESGSGKSTTGLAILRLLAKTGNIKNGEIIFEGNDLVKKSKRWINKEIRGNKISMVIQNPQNALNPVFTVGEQIIDVLKYNNYMDKDSKKSFKEKAIEILNEMGIADPEYRIDEYPHQFSGGMKQRVMLAMAFISNPSLLIADEPTTALDVTVEAQILELLRELVDKYQTSVLYITHDLSVIHEITDRTAVMYAGNIVEMAPTKKLFKNPVHPYTKGLLRCLPGKNKRDEILPTIDGKVPSLTELPPGCNFCERCDVSLARCKKDEPEFIKIADDHYISCFQHQVEKEGSGKNGIS